LYGAGLYTNNVHPTTWFLLFGSALCGISAGFFWAAEAAIIIGYPSPTERAFYLAVWQTAKASGPIVGGAINLGLNAGRSTAGSVGSSTCKSQTRHLSSHSSRSYNSVDMSGGL
jgi:MFS family permease